MASLTLVLHLLLINTAAGYYYHYQHIGGSLNVIPKGKNLDGTYEVELRDQLTTLYCSVNSYSCLYGDCGSQIQSSQELIARDSIYAAWCQKEVKTRRKLNSNLPFGIKYPAHYNGIYGLGNWMTNNQYPIIPWKMMAHIDLGTRSDTGEANRPPVVTILPFLRVMRNCPRTFNLTVFDPDGDHVRCRLPTNSNTNECGQCSLPNGFSFDQNSCSLTFTHFTGHWGYHPAEIVLEDFPKKQIKLFYSDQSFTVKNSVSMGRNKRAVIPATTTGTPTTTMGTPTTTTPAPTTTTTAPTTTSTLAPTTTMGTPTTTTAAPTTSTLAPTTTMGTPTTTTLAPTTTTAAPTTSTLAPTTTMGTPTTTTPAPTTTMGTPTTTTAAPTTTTAAPTTTTAAPTTSTPAPTTSTPTLTTTTPAPTTTTPSPTTTTPSPTTTTPSPTTTTPAPTTTTPSPTTTTPSPTITTPSPTTTTPAATTTTPAPTTTTPAPTTTTGAPTTTTAAPTTTTAAPTTTTGAPVTTTGAPVTTTAAPTTTTGAPTTTTAAPKTTTGAPVTTTGAPVTATAAPTTATAAPTTTTGAPITTTGAPVTITAAPTTSSMTLTTSSEYYPPVASLSKVPLQFSVYVDNIHSPSCADGDYFPVFLSPTPFNGAYLTAFVNQTLEITVRSSALYTTILDLLVTGPGGISKQRTSKDEYIIKWTPTDDDLNGHFPICFVSEGKSRYYTYQSELRCVTVEVGHHEATVTCSEQTITVEVEKNELIRRTEDTLHLNDFTGASCNLSTLSNATHLVAVMSLNTCGTLVEEDDDNIIFKNQITSADPNDVISRKNDVEIAFSCAYPKRTNLTLGFTHKNPYAFRERGFGTFTFQFEFFESQLFRKQINANTYPVEVYLRQMMFMQIEATTDIPNTELFVESCRATPYDNPNSRISYTIIENGCVKDQTVQIYPSSKAQFRFGMEAFGFIGAFDEVYITCSVLLCESGIHGTRCSQGCLDSKSSNHRIKREVAAQTRSHSISQGPLHLVKTSDSEASGLSLNLGTNLVFIVGCLLVCGVVIYRSRRSKANYQPLPTHETD